MSACTYCAGEIVWVPTLEGVRPFQPLTPISPDAVVAVLDRHDCEERQRAFKVAAEDFARHLAMDPVIDAKARTLTCPLCSATPGAACYDLRKGAAPGKTNKHCHQPRLLAAARLMQT